ncbi:MAG: nucleoside triphosphate pyrophosphohydrolase [Halobacteriovoraceae bacterium]|nr:nucleoside triphosphate pyrophosphohydrolase [Halobacteriovoraceae bacterium]
MESSFLRLYEIVKKLRDPKDGCPWDLEQTHTSLLKNLIEETYEYIAAVEKKDFSNMQEELGDILLQVLMHAIMAEEQGPFDLTSVMDKLSDKLVHRHPHVFKKADKAQSPQEALENWNKMKNQERKNPKEHLIDEKYLDMPSLMSAQKIGDKSHKIGFDWPDINQVSYKVEEEWQELKEEMGPVGKYNRSRVAEEMGDFLFSTVQLARHLDLDAEEILRQANKKFIHRFKTMEDLIKREGMDISKMDQKQMDHFWDRSKMEKLNET